MIFCLFFLFILNSTVFLLPFRCCFFFPILVFYGFHSSLSQLAWDKRLCCCYCQFLLIWYCSIEQEPLGAVLNGSLFFERRRRVVCYLFKKRTWPCLSALFSIQYTFPLFTLFNSSPVAFDLSWHMNLIDMLWYCYNFATLVLLCKCLPSYFIILVEHNLLESCVTLSNWLFFPPEYH
jgi:hypothetical protein